ncbi:MAG: zinc ABC transporter substrate-binding protein [Rhodocyclaceae bacterium]|nr:zinc ABC transporter substrate-binding protein [Rhodocyclaceae bacterium]
MRAAFILLALLIVAPTPAAAAKLKVVSSFSLLADMCRVIGGDRIELTNLVPPGTDAHGYQPRPADARAVAQADIVVMNGLGFEGWIERLLRAGSFPGVLVVASEGVRLLEHDGDAGHHGHEHGEARTEDATTTDPHAWQDLRNGHIYARNIALAFARADEPNAAYYLQRLETFLSRIDALDSRFRREFAEIPPDARRIVTSHDAFGYLARAYGLEFLAPVGLSSSARPSAAQVAALIRQLRAQRAAALFVESLSDPRLIERIQAETGTHIGGTLYADSLTGADGEAASYLAMMTHNLEALARALRR